MSKKLRIGELLVKAGRISESQLNAALAEQKNYGRLLGSTLVRMGFIGEGDLIEALARQLNLPVARLDGKRLEPEVLALIPVQIAQKYRCLPLFVKGDGGGNVLYVGMEYPSDLAAVDDLSFNSGTRIQPVLVAPSELHEAIDRYYRPSSKERPSSVDPDDTFTDFKQAESVPAAAAESAASTAAAPPAVEDLLDALTSLLVEKRLITREDLAAQLRSVQDGAARSR